MAASEGECFTSHQFVRPTGFATDPELRTSENKTLATRSTAFLCESETVWVYTQRCLKIRVALQGLRGLERCAVGMQERCVRVPERVPRDARLLNPIERQVIIDALKAASGKISGRGGAAERLGLKRTTLQNKIRKLNVSRGEYSA